MDSFWYFRHSSTSVQTTHQTALLIPLDSVDLPNVELWPTQRTKTLSLFGINGLNFTTEEHAPAESKHLVDRFNKTYSILDRGGFLAQASGTEPTSRLSAGAGLWTRSVLEFFVQNPGWKLEAKNGHLVIYKYDSVLSVKERERLLEFALEFIRRLKSAEREPELQGLRIKDTNNIPMFIGTLAGTFGGFLLGGFSAMLTFFITGNKVIFFAFPVFAIVGAVIGRVVGRKIASSIGT
ncbi:MAG: hypothetical protein AAF492_25510 [Verrucomicrobiota bacterium]